MRRTVGVTYEPLSQWPAGRERTPEYERVDAKFKASGGYEKDASGGDRWVGGKRTPLSRTLEDLDRELWQASAQDVVVQIDVTNKDEFRRNLRADGEIRSDTRTKSPAIVVSFKRNGVPTTFATDHFKRWEDNLRAIVLGMESLRRLERYHIVRAGDQYRGWQALPSSTTPALSSDSAAQVVAARSADNPANLSAVKARILTQRDYARAAVRIASARTHPDAGGTTADFQLVQEAKRVLEAHHGGAL